MRGVTGLRVVDASAFPNVTSGNTNTPTLALAEKGADLTAADATGKTPLTLAVPIDGAVDLITKLSQTAGGNPKPASKF